MSTSPATAFADELLSIKARTSGEKEDKALAQKLKIRLGDVLVVPPSIRGRDIDQLRPRLNYELYSRVTPLLDMDRYGHAALYTGKGKVIDAVQTGVRELPLSKLIEESGVAVLRPRDVTQQDRLEAIEMMQKAKERAIPYSAAQAVKAWANRNVLGLKGRDRRQAMDSMICSSLIAEAYRGKATPQIHPDLTLPVDFIESPKMQLLSDTTQAPAFVLRTLMRKEQTADPK